MLTLTIQGDSYNLYPEIKKQQDLRHEILSSGKYKDTDIVIFLDGDFEIDRCTIEDLYNTSKDSGIKYTTPIERVRNAGLTLPGK